MLAQLRPFRDSYQDFLNCSLQLALLLFCLGGLLRQWASETGVEDQASKDLGNTILIFTLFWSFTTILWAVIRDVTIVIGRKHILRSINKTTGSSLELFQLSLFDTGLHPDVLYHFSEAGKQPMQLYLEMRGFISSAKQPLRSAEFWKGLKVLRRQRRTSVRQQQRRSQTTDHAISIEVIESGPGVGSADEDDNRELSPMQISRVRDVYF